MFEGVGEDRRRRGQHGTPPPTERRDERRAARRAGSRSARARRPRLARSQNAEAGDQDARTTTIGISASLVDGDRPALGAGDGSDGAGVGVAGGATDGAVDGDAAAELVGTAGVGLGDWRRGAATVNDDVPASMSLSSADRVVHRTV